MFCGKCGTQLPDLGKFCPRCGAPVIPFPTAEAVAEPEEVMTERAADGFDAAPTGLKWDLPEEPEPAPEQETIRPVVWQVISEQKTEVPAEPVKTAEPVKPAEPVRAAEPEKPAEPVRVTEPEKPAEPVRFSEPVNFADHLKAAEEPDDSPLYATPGSTPDTIPASPASSSSAPAGETNGIASLLTFCAIIVYIGSFIIGIILGKVLGQFSFAAAVIYWAVGLLSGSMMLGIAEIIKLLHEINKRR